MKREDIFARLFDFEFCDPPEKPEKERAFNEALAQACEQTGKPLYILKPAILKLYPKYRAQRLRNELPNIPPKVREQ